MNRHARGADFHLQILPIIRGTFFRLVHYGDNRTVTHIAPNVDVGGIPPVANSHPPSVSCQSSASALPSALAVLLRGMIAERVWVVDGGYHRTSFL